VVRRKPHTLTVSLPSDKVDGTTSRVTGVTQATGVAVRGVLMPKTFVYAAERFNIECARPHLFLCDVGDFARFKAGGRATSGGLTYVVKVVQKKEALGGADHVAVLLDQVVF
jgi:hypothetical protein